MTHRRTCGPATAAAFLLLVSAPAWCQGIAQLPPPPPPPEPPTFTAEANLVTLHVSVLDKDGRLITDVPRAAFHVFENGEEQQIRLFQREDVPVSMCILIDSSGSMRRREAAVAAAALELVRASNPQDEVCYVNYNDEAWLDQDFTSDIGRLEAAMKKMDPRGATAMRVAIDGAVDHVLGKGKHDKKVLVVVSDGEDNVSGDLPSMEKLIPKVRDSGVLIYLIGLLNDEDRRAARNAKRDLERLAEASGGLVFFPEDVAQVQAITPQIAHEIRNQYIVAYRPANEVLDGSYRQVKVEVKGVRNLKDVRTRSGYYAGGAAGPARGGGFSTTPK
jgi:VWFA-related protein